MTEIYIDQPVLIDHLGVVRISGEDSYRFLNGQITLEMDAVNAQNLSPASVCNPKGKVVANFLITATDEGYLVVLPVGMIQTFIAHLSKYAVFYKSKIEDVSAEHELIGYHASTEQNSVIYSGTDRTLKFALRGSTQMPPNNELWQALDMAQGLTWVTPETSELFIPQHINQQWLDAISFKKGCYTGQEVITRTHYKGKLRRFTHRLTGQNTLKPGDKIFNSKSESIGQVINSNQDQVLVVGDYRGMEQQFFNSSGELLHLEFSKLPYSDRIQEYILALEQA